MTLLTSLAFLVYLCTVWGMCCIILTWRQRLKLINDRPRPPGDWRSYAREYDAVSYEQHLWCLMRLGDPRKLYGPLTQEIW